MKFNYFLKYPVSVTVSLSPSKRQGNDFTADLLLTIFRLPLQTAFVKTSQRAAVIYAISRDRIDGRNFPNCPRQP